MSEETNIIPDDDVVAASIDTCPNGIALIDMPEDDMIESITEQYLDGLTMADKWNIKRIKSNLYHLTTTFIIIHNKKKKDDKWRRRPTLYPAQIAMIIKKFYQVVRINMGGEETEFNSKYALLAIYEEAGDNEGIYIADDASLTNIIYRYNKHINKPEKKQVLELLEDMSEVVQRCSDPDLIAVKNGIFNYKTKQVMPFSPDYVFTAKCKIPYIADPPNPIIKNPTDGTVWDIESWMNELFEDDPEVVNALWEIIGATIRPNVAWNKAVWLLSTRGNNGKGTLCELIRNLIGHGSYASIKLKDFSKDFMLEPLIHSTAIITDENDVGTYIDQAANLKAIITGDTIQINRKFQPAISYQFRGFMIQCVNEVPKIRDRSESFYRRQLIIKFKKSYTGIERKYIKEEYLQRDDVLQYVLNKVLNMDYYEIHEPESSKEQMASYKVHNDPVRDFLEDILPNITVDALPNQYLYELYGAWLDKNNPSAKRSMLGRSNFISEVRELIPNYPEWYVPDGQFRIRNYIDGQELTVNMYNMTNWMTDEKSADPEVKYHLKWTRPCMDGILRSECKDVRKKKGRPSLTPIKNNNDLSDKPEEDTDPNSDNSTK